jgi:DNA-binding NarL/FixJ family response regulator
VKSKTTRPSPDATERQKNSVFIVEDHPVFREGLVQVLNREKDLAVCGQAGTAEEAQKLLRRLHPDLLLVDITLPGKSGLQLIKDLRKSGNNVKVLVVSIHDEALYADRVLRAGADGYIMKQEDPNEIVHAIRDVLQGHIYVSESVLGLVADESPKALCGGPESRLDLLSDEQLVFLELLGQGKSEEEIAAATKNRLEAVKSSCAEIRKKLGLKTANQLIRFAVCWVETSTH